MPSASIPAALAATAATAGAGTAAAGAGAAAATGLSLGSELAIGATLASTAVGAVGAIQSSKAQAAAAGYNSQVSANNAKIATQNAQYAGAEGNQNVAAAGQKARATEGAILANQGASGVDVNSGSSVDTRESEAKIGMLNELNIRSQAARTAYGYQTQSASDTGQAGLYQSEQSSDQTAGDINAASTVLGGASKAAGYYTPNSTGNVLTASSDTIG